MGSLPYEGCEGGRVGQITERLSVAAPRFRKIVELLLRVKAQKIVDETVTKAAPDGPLDGWPIGRERNRPHSYTLFTIESTIKGSSIRVTIKNSALYATAIHERGRPKNFVWLREIKRKISKDLAGDLARELPAAFIKAWNGR